MMYPILVAVTLSAVSPQPVLMDGLESVVVVEQAKQYASEARSFTDVERRNYVASRLTWNARELHPRDRVWIAKVSDWASTPYDVHAVVVDPEWKVIYKHEFIVGGKQ